MESIRRKYTSVYRENGTTITGDRSSSPSPSSNGTGTGTTTVNAVLENEIRLAKRVRWNIKKKAIRLIQCRNVIEQQVILGTAATTSIGKGSSKQQQQPQRWWWEMWSSNDCSSQQ